jgi:hypothetical protein
MRERRAEEIIDHFVALVLGHIDREYPNKLDHVINDASELKSPRELHPIFYGSFDWHSSVHGHWLLVRALRHCPVLAQGAEVRALLDRRLNAESVKGEIEYLGHPRRETFERTYGWAWLLKLAAELKGVNSGAGGRGMETAEALARWDRILEPLTAAFVDRFLKYLPKATYPIRVGTHTNTAFALALGIDYAKAAGNAALGRAIEEKARKWYLKDENDPGREPDGTDFLSPCLIEAECMRRILEEREFAGWFDRYLPGFAAGRAEPAALFEPAFVSDRTDGQITHLDGLNLSRAWCWRSISRTFSGADPRRAMAEKAYATHLDAALPHVSGDYMGEHWLATFALLAMTE